MIGELARELGFRVERRGADEIALPLGGGAVLLFANLEGEDCLVGFDGGTWHGHGEVMFMCDRDRYVELDALDIVIGLEDGTMLVCEEWREVVCVDRWLVHGDRPELACPEVESELRLRRARKGS